MNKLSVLHIPASPSLQESFVRVAHSKQLHSRQFLRDLVQVFAAHAIRKRGALAGNRTLTKKHKVSRQAGGLILPVSQNFNKGVERLCEVLGCSREAVILNIMEFVVSTERRRGLKL